MRRISSLLLILSLCLSIICCSEVVYAKGHTYLESLTRGVSVGSDDINGIAYHIMFALDDKNIPKLKRVIHKVGHKIKRYKPKKANTSLSTGDGYGDTWKVPYYSIVYKKSVKSATKGKWILKYKGKTVVVKLGTHTYSW